MAVESLDALDYHERTNHSPASVRTSSRRLDFDNRPDPDLEYVGLPTIDLCDAIGSLSMPTLSAIAVSDRGAPDEVPNRETIATLAQYSVGITTELELRDRTARFRAAACTGALYHIDLYLICGELSDLDAGVYHVDPRGPSLDVLRTGDVRGILAEAAGTDVSEAPVTVVATSTWWRNAWKYDDRTYRHAFWDGGTVLANLLAGAHALDQPASVITGFVDDTIVEVLGLDPDEIAPIALVPIGGGMAAPAIGAVETIDPTIAPLSPDPRSQPAVSAAWRAGRLADGVEVRRWRDAAEPMNAPPTEARSRIAIDPVDDTTATARPLGLTIQRRGSCRRYELSAVSFRQFSTVLDRAVRGVPMDVRSSDDPPVSFVEAYILVNDVEGLEAGIYQFDPIDGVLVQLRVGSDRPGAGHLALDQRLGADAAACIYLMADLEAMVDRLGDRGYRVAQLEAGLTMGRLYLATYAHRTLGGTGLTFYDDVVTEYLSPWASGRSPMTLYTIGRPASR